MSAKIELGQFYTTTNPFLLEPFLNWFNNIEDINKEIILEPFAGANNIPAMFKEVSNNTWECYDISPSDINKCDEFKILQQDTIEHFPTGFNISITNPPYLGKSAAIRKGIKYLYDFDDLYKVCLHIMLDNLKYIAAIIPETFIIAPEFKNRLNTVISLTCKMFDDTACPVCLALFGPDTSDDFNIYRLNEFLGTYKELKKYDIKDKSIIKWVVNAPEGNIGVKCIDDAVGAGRVKFDLGDNIISSDKIKVSSRTLTRVSGLPEDIDINIFISICNNILDEYRLKTKDVFMASFKCLRADGLYRRRLDYKTLKHILNKAYNIYLKS